MARLSSRSFRTAAALLALAILVSGPVVWTKQADANGNVPNSYIIVLRDEVDPDAVGQQMAAEHGLAVEHVYHSVINGFAAVVPSGKLAAIERDSRVAFVSEDRLVQADGKPSSGGSGSSQPPQATPTGIRRIGTGSSAGAGVSVAIIDTGIDLKHADLAANIVADTSCITGKRTGADDNGHGTHVAGTIAALNNTIGVVGVAPEAGLIAVKSLNSQGSGSWSSIICGLDWVTAHASAYQIRVVNMSLGGSGSSDNNCGLTNNDALHQAICRTRDAGVTIVVAAGNEGADATASVPAAYDDAVITVSALADSDGRSGGLGSATSYGADDTFASFSNYGSPVDIAAPGVSILSTWKGNTYNTISGTSMATPHVAGAAALYLASHPEATWTQVRDALIAASESLNAGHTDPSGLHPEGVLNTAAF